MKDSNFLKEVVFNNNKINAFRFYFITILMSILVAGFFYYFDRFSKIPFAPIISQALILFIALIGLGMFFTKKRRLQKTMGDNAYRTAFYRYHVTFIPFIYISALHPLFIPTHYGIMEIENTFYIRFILAFYFLTTGILLHIRSRKLFGIDNLFMYYVYYPNESKIIKSVIHLILRHPIYSAMSRIAIGLALINGNLTSVIIALLLTCNQIFWLYFYEEPDLIKRFGCDYKQLKQKVPALFIKPKNTLIFIKFLLGLKK